MPASADLISRLRPDPGLAAFRPPEQVHEQLRRLAGSVDAQVLVAYHRESSSIAGYTAFHLPDSRVRWGRARLPDVWELGATEVAPRWRRGGLARAMLHEAFRSSFFDDKVVISTEYAWHWDLTATKLARAEYRRLLLDLFGREGFQEFDTDEPNIAADPANIFMVRVGSRASHAAVDRILGMLRERGAHRYTVTVQGTFKRFRRYD